jgi:hypothetical protein
MALFQIAWLEGVQLISILHFSGHFSLKSRTDEILAAGWIALVLSQVVKESLDIPAPGGNRAGRNKAVCLLRTVGTIPQLPGIAAHGGRRNLGTYGLYLAISGQPERFR